MINLYFRRVSRLLAFFGLCIALASCGEQLDPNNNKKDAEIIQGTWEGVYEVGGEEKKISVQFHQGDDEKTAAKYIAQVTWEEPARFHNEKTVTYTAWVGEGITFDRYFEEDEEDLGITIFFDYSYDAESKSLSLSRAAKKPYPHCKKLKATLWGAYMSGGSYACAKYVNEKLKHHNLPHYEGQLPDTEKMPVSIVMDNKDDPFLQSTHKAYEKAYRTLAKALFSDEVNFAAHYSQFAAMDSLELKKVHATSQETRVDDTPAETVRTAKTQRQTEASPPVQAKPHQNESVKPQQGTTSPSLAAKQKELLGKLLTLSQALALENQNKLEEFEESLKAVGFSEAFLSCDTPAAARYKDNCDRLDSLFGVYKKDIEIAFSDGHLALQVMTVGKHALDSGNAEAMALAIGSLQEQVALSKGLYDSLQRTTIVGEMVKEAKLIKAKMN